MNFKLLEKEAEVLFDKILTKANQCEEDCLKEVLRQLVKREPTPEDAKRVTIYRYEGVHDSYDIAFDGVKVGTVNRIYDECNFKVEFTPAPPMFS